jgi:hypothetical protein
MNPDFADLLLAFNAHEVRYLVAGAPLDRVDEGDFARPGIVFHMGLPPGRIDVLTELTALTFGEAWASRLDGSLGDVPVAFIGREAFIRNKQATGRIRDLDDVESLLD